MTKKMAEILGKAGAFSAGSMICIIFLDTKGPHRGDFGPKKGSPGQSDLDLTSVLGGQKG